jgi:dTDP-4-amino-4,6-dideoxygalactose transaminase
MNEAGIPLAEPFLGGNEGRYLEECIATNFVSSVGPFVDRFERSFAAYVGSQSAIACSSGTAALHVGLQVAGVGPGDEVLVPSFTFIASANAVRYLRARPTFIDSEETTWNLDPSIVVDELNRRARQGRPLPKAVMVVHILGHPADVAPIADVCDRHGVVLVEDAAEALGASYVEGKYDGRQVGTVGIVGCFSFNGNKVITTGGGGMIVTDRPDLAARARHLTTQARLPGLAYQHDEVGYNYRLSNLAAAVGLAQIEQLSTFLMKKRKIAEDYDRAFRDREGFRTPPNEHWARRSAWLYSLRVRDPRRVEPLIEGLQSVGIGARPVWSPVHAMAPYRNSPFIGTSVAARIASTTVSLPSSVGLDISDQDRVIARVNELLQSAT